MGHNITDNRHIYNITSKKSKYYSKASDNNIKISRGCIHQHTSWDIESPYWNDNETNETYTCSHVLSLSHSREKTLALNWNFVFTVLWLHM